MTTAHRPARVAIAIAAAAALTAAAAGAAQANAPSEHSTFTIDESGSFDADVCGFAMDWHDTGRGSALLHEDPRSGDELILQRLDLTSVFTNPTNGDWFGLSGHWSEHLLPATVMPDGTVVSVLKEPGNRHNLFDGSGIISRDTGLTTWTFTYDPATDTEEAAVEVHGRFPLAGSDFCAIAQDLIG
ncbi:hypothetical protein [Pedococcus sp. P5_B7]